MTKEKFSLIKIFFIVILFVAIPLCAYSTVTIYLKDGNTFVAPVNANDILSISFDSTAKPVTTRMPAAPPISNGLVVWLDASDLSNLFQTTDGSTQVSGDGQSVGLWRDKSGNYNNMVQAKAENRPQLFKSGIANKTTISFERNQSLSMATNFPSPVSVFYVGRMTGGVNGRILQSISNNWLLGYWSNAKNQAHFDGWVSPPGSPPTDNLPHVFTAIVAGAGHNSEVWPDGNLIATNQGGVTGPNGLAINSGAYGGETSNCQVAELLLYNRALSSEERSNVETYLKEKWNLAK